MSDVTLMADEKCACCGSNRDGSFEIEIIIEGGCDCAGRAPTVPVYRDASDHLSDCRLRKLGHLMIRRMSHDLGMGVEVSEQ